ncbi:hypothetical protein [Pantanalinema sp. GBBB05]|uniref:hypothetical protein n=1 Tax=Pantanalinema sp. GBBB05 TaxID=2604139 RepID=UPI001DB182E8|nr:hypothetical protein [Pantanalinema sp. GBBB05]
MTNSNNEGAVSKSKRQAKQPKFQRSVAYVPVEALDVANTRLNELVTNRLTLQTAISKLYDRIKASLEQGISYEELATTLTGSGIQITVTRLKQLLTAEAKARGVSRRRTGARGKQKNQESEPASGNGTGSTSTPTLKLTALPELNGQSNTEVSHETTDGASASKGRKRAAKTTKAAASTKAATKPTTSKPKRTKTADTDITSTPAAGKSARGSSTRRRSTSRKTS